TGITRAPIDQVGVGIVGAGHPGGGRTRLPAFAGPGIVARFAGTRHGPETPDSFAGLGIVSVDQPAHPQFSARDPGDDLVFDRQRGDGDTVAGLVVGDLHIPQRTAGAPV